MEYNVQVVSSICLDIQDICWFWVSGWWSRKCVWAGDRLRAAPSRTMFLGRRKLSLSSGGGGLFLERNDRLQTHSVLALLHRRHGADRSLWIQRSLWPWQRSQACRVLDFIFLAAVLVSACLVA